jgi:hypothetical protein
MPLALLFLSACVGAIAVVSLRYQIRNWRRLRSETFASDDRRYIRGMCQRRTLNAVLMLGLAGMLAGAFFSGGLEELGRLAQVKQEDLTEDDRDTVRALAWYWIGVLGLLFFVIVVAMSDYVATSLYGRQQYRRIQHEQRTLLERDLAVYRQQKLNNRMKKLG